MKIRVLVLSEVKPGSDALVGLIAGRHAYREIQA